MPYCDKCGNEVDVHAELCSVCGRQLRMPSSKKAQRNNTEKITLTIGLLMGILIIAFFLFGLLLLIP